jgi:hypothetical protein
MPAFLIYAKCLRIIDSRYFINIKKFQSFTDADQIQPVFAFHAE